MNAQMPKSASYQKTKLWERNMGAENERNWNICRTYTAPGFRGSACVEIGVCTGCLPAEAHLGAEGAGVWHLSDLESVCTSADI